MVKINVALTDKSKTISIKVNETTHKISFVCYVHKTSKNRFCSMQILCILFKQCDNYVNDDK